jgi:hypothetical protein
LWCSRLNVADVSDDTPSTAEYNELLESIRQTLTSARIRAARAVNHAFAQAYWEIGHDIAKRQQEADHDSDD